MDDLVEGLVRLMDKPTEFTGPVNLGNPNEITILRLAETIIELVGSSSRVVHEALPQDDPRRRCPDIRLAERELGGWHPTVTLEEGLKRTIAYFDQLMTEG